ncbi:uncharacterized protein LOC128866670 [Anastrepha ludens]|uniref:uncharacterized protein LOC128866670 n=1 Tax=Anastrepha ludens TaxID=28586 RepID=UPI0023B17F34|nr:uncharacterized protein LOC128866670 [Anastrepha ludens]
MSSAQVFQFLFLIIILTSSSSASCSRDSHLDNLKFSLVRTCQRSEMSAIAYKNTATLEDCVRATIGVRGLALNFGTRARSKQNLKGSKVFEILLTEQQLQQITRPNDGRYDENHQSVWQQPQAYFNCHMLACPENNTLRSLVNDRRYDYYSLYGELVASHNYSCIPQVGLFQLQVLPTNFLNATKFCRNITGVAGIATLAHVASAARTDAFAELLSTYNEHARQMRGRQYTLAYVGLHFNRSYTTQSIEYINMDDEPLRCFQFVAWAPGHPRTSANFANISCIAVTKERTWMTVDCERELPFICEIYTSRSDLNETAITAGACASNTYTYSTLLNTF